MNKRRIAYWAAFAGVAFNTGYLCWTVDMTMLEIIAWSFSVPYAVHMMIRLGKPE